MKVHYTSLEAQIRDAIRRADEINRRIDHIELTVDEANEFHDACRKLASPYSHPYVRPPYTFADCGSQIGTMYGVTLKIHPAIDGGHLP